MSDQPTALYSDHCGRRLHFVGKVITQFEQRQIFEKTHQILHSNSRAIMTYLCNKYAGNSIYPSDPRKRAEVDKLLYFDIGTLYKALGEAIYPVFLHGAKQIEEEKEKAFRGKLDLLEGFLAKGKYVAGDALTIADFAIHTSLGTADMIDYDFSAYKNITAWRQRLATELPYDKEVNQDTIAAAKVMFAEKLAAAKKD